MGLYYAQFRSYHTEVCWEHPLNAGLSGGFPLCHFEGPSMVCWKLDKITEEGSSGYIQAVNSVPESIQGALEGLNDETYLLK